MINQCELVIGKISQFEKHPNSDKLNNETESIVFFLHGYGANQSDLVFMSKLAELATAWVTSYLPNPSRYSTKTPT